MASAPGAIHEQPESWPWVDDPERWEHSEHAFVFTLVRNPYARVLSAYLDKINEPAIWGPFTARHGVGDDQLSFIEFLRLVADESPEQMDPHWRPQSHIVAPRIVPYDFIGTMENFEHDLRHILQRIFHVEMPLWVHRPHRTDAIERMAEYAPEARTLVRRIYEIDFVELGYSTDPDRLERQRPVARAACEPLRHWGAGLRLLRNGDVARAAGQLEQASRWLHSPLIGERLVTCRLHLAQGRKPAEPELALADLARIKDLATGSPRLAGWTEQHGLAAMLRVVERHEKARPDDAVQLMAQVVALWPSDHRVWKRYGGALAAAGRDEAALEALIRGMVVLGPGRRRRRQRLNRLRRSLAFLRARQRRREDALAALRLGQMPEAGRRSESLRPLSAFWAILNRTVVHVTASAAILIPAQASFAGGSSRADGTSS